MAPSQNARAFISSLTTLDCPMCEEKLDSNHPPVMIAGCRHIFGKQCLKRWVESSKQGNDKCPTCRNPLYGENGQVQDSTQTPQSPGRIAELTQLIRGFLPNRSTRARTAPNQTASRRPPGRTVTPRTRSSTPPRARQPAPRARQFSIGFAGPRAIIPRTRLDRDGTQGQFVRDTFVNMLMPHFNSSFDSRRQGGSPANNDDGYSSSSSYSSPSSSSSEDEWEERYGPGRSVYYRR
jgi:hypothetical protein